MHENEIGLTTGILQSVCIHLNKHKSAEDHQHLHLDKCKGDLFY